MVELRIKGNVQQVLDIGRIRLLGSSLAVACISGRTEVQLTVATGGSGLENGRRCMRWQPSWVWYWYYFFVVVLLRLGTWVLLGSWALDLGSCLDPAGAN
jgi:H+/Cl- antiporter ClcA